MRRGVGAAAGVVWVVARDHPVRDIVASRPSFTGGEKTVFPLLS
jgi:hypothetical protein